jgi:trans-2,3-dihydro-3-hydroxyanthranilate isomerase
LEQHAPEYKLNLVHVGKAAMREIEYMIFDVFTNKAFAGNPLGVVLNGDGLSDKQMQAIAREFNLSETIFFQAPDNALHTAKVRIFMPNGELPFAGHPTIGGAIACAGARGLGKDTHIVLEEGVGPVLCRVTANEYSGQASFVVPRLSQQGELHATIDEIAAALGIGASDIGFAAHTIAHWSAGVPYVMVPVRELSVLQTLSLDPNLWCQLDVEHEGRIAAPFVYAQDGVLRSNVYRARMFSPWDGIPEDPATGSAAAAFSGAVWRAESMETGVFEITIHQGIEMGRPSLIILNLEGSESVLSSATISGEAVKVAQGKLFLPD